MTPLISVIVPVYNVEEYLDRCVESIVNQTYQNLEIILVDDGSTDSSGKKCDKWANKDNRIVVIHKKNGGQSSARNQALKIAKGDLIGFVDSDDYIDSTMYEKLIDCLNNNNCDIVECTKIDFDNQTPKCISIGSGNVLVFNRKEAIEDFIKEKHFKCTVWNMLLKASIAKNVMFDEGKTHEDILWPYRAYMLAERISYVDYALYFYFQRPSSTMNMEYSEKRFDGLDALEKRAELVRNDFPDLYHIATKSYLGACMYQYQFLCRQPKRNKYEKYKKILHNRFCNGNQKALFEGLSLKYRMWYTLFRIAPKLTVLIRNTLKIGL